MQKAAPSVGRIAVMVGFALSCFGLLLFLWLAFGGPIPLKPKGYRFVASFSEATQLAQEADVRISGVPVGKVKTIEPDKTTGRSNVVIQLDRRYAPLPSDAKAILRQKTLLGETYVELTPGTERRTAIPEGGSCRTAQVSPTVELDEIFRAFDPRTRRAFQVWMQTQAQAIKGHGRDINDALGNLGPFAEDASVAVDILNRQEGALRRLVSNTGVVFDALTERGDQLRGLIENSNLVFATTAARDRELQEAFVALPTFERESTRDARPARRVRGRHQPARHPAAAGGARAEPDARPTCRRSRPTCNALFRDLDKLITASRTGFPAAERILRDLRPLLAQIDPALRQLIPILEVLGAYKGELNSFFANTASATQAFDPGTRLHYLRTTNPLNPENLAAYPRRIGSNRPNPYQLPGGYRRLDRSLQVYETRHCGRTAPTISTAAGPVPVADRRARAVPDLPVPVPTAVPTVVPPEVSGITQALIDRINQFAFPLQGARPGAGVREAGQLHDRRRVDATTRTSRPSSAPILGSVRALLERVVRAAGRRPGRVLLAVAIAAGISRRARAAARAEHGDRDARRQGLGLLPGDRGLPRALRRPRDRRARPRRPREPRADRQPRAAARARGLPVGQQAARTSRRRAGRARRAPSSRARSRSRSSTGRGRSSTRRSARSTTSSRSSSAPRRRRPSARRRRRASWPRRRAAPRPSRRRRRRRPSSSSTRSSRATC